MPTIPARKLKGFRDLSGDLLASRMEILEIIRKEASLAAFQWIDTPSLEYAETLLGKGGDTDKQVYTFLDKGKREVALRYDLTMPFARFFAENPTPYLPYRKVQVGKVWRAEKPQRGRYREFVQCDFDIVGKDNVFEDMEIITILVRCLYSCQLSHFTVSLGHRGILTYLLKHICHLHSPDVITQALIALDKLTKMGRDKVIGMLKELHIQDIHIHTLLDALQTKDKELEALLLSLAKDSPTDSTSQDITRLLITLHHLRHIFSDTTSIQFVIDLSLARGLNYYTGIVFETTLQNLPEAGSICSGGRYDLSGHFSKTLPPCVGGSIGVDRIVSSLQHTLSPPTTPPAVFLVGDLSSTVDIKTHNLPTFLGLQRVAHILRNAGIAVQHCLDSKNISKQYKQASKRSTAQHALFIENVETLKDMKDKDILSCEVKHKNLTSTQEITTTLKGFLKDQQSSK
ncbi:MAG: histidine--tRNA ligase [Proteobacteria bacterium]|nr:histidine--tRNA ligase [Pseudomonadota bacterium]